MSLDDAGPARRWIDLHTAASITGIRPVDLVWAITRGDVRMSSVEPGHFGTPMVDLADVKWVAGRLGRA
jgi:hypothetical protein